MLSTEFRDSIKAYRHLCLLASLAGRHPEWARPFGLFHGNLATHKYTGRK